MGIPVNDIYPIAWMHDLSPAYTPPPNVAGWIQYPTMSGVTQQVAPWLLAQGWVINNVNTNANPALTTYDLYKVDVATERALAELCNQYTSAYNEGRYKNDIRYEDIMRLWNDLVVKSAAHLDTQQVGENFYFTTFLNLSYALTSSMSSLIDATKSQVEQDSDDIRTQLAATLAVIDQITVNYAAHLAKIEAELTSNETYLTQFLADDNANLTTLLSDYTTHAATSRALLLGLGTTRTTEINEKYDSDKAKARGDLIRRGINSSDLITAVDARVERDRTTELTRLAEDLAREKNENEHRLHGQLVAVRQAAIAGTRGRYEAQFRTNATAMGERHRLYSEVLQALIEKARGYDSNARMTIAVSDMLSQAHGRLVVNMMEVAKLRLTDTQAAYDRQMEMFRYALGTRNQLVLGLLGMMEKREDSYPTLDALATLSAQLGSGGSVSWVSP